MFVDLILEWVYLSEQMPLKMKISRFGMASMVFILLRADIKVFLATCWVIWSFSLTPLLAGTCDNRKEYDVPANHLYGVEAIESSTERLEVLFIGNSYTYSNGGLGGMLRDLAQGAGFLVPRTQMEVWGGLTLTDHCSRQETLDAIDSRDWDYIILQEYDYGPTHYGTWPRTVEAFMEASRTLNARIQGNNAANGWSTQVVFFETWAREPGATLKYPDNIPAYPDVFEDPEEMQSELRANNNAIAKELGAEVARCGDSWEHAFAVEPFPGLILHGEDGSHPNCLGSYLNGLIFLKTIYGVEDTTGLPYEDLAYGKVTITEEEAAFLQSIANISPFLISNIERSAGGAAVILTWRSVAGKEYTVYYSDDPCDSSMTWITADEAVPASGTGTNTWVDDGTMTGGAPGSVPHRYYKVGVQVSTDE
jgi:hypothetical protein